MIDITADGEVKFTFSKDEPWIFQFKFNGGSSNPVCFIRFQDTRTKKYLPMTIRSSPAVDAVVWTVTGETFNFIRAQLPFEVTSSLGLGLWTADLIRGSVEAPQGRIAVCTVRQVNPGEAR